MNNSNLIKGMITDIQKFSLHDGPGIRTVIFFKGCCLDCPWCCNPETISKFPEIGHSATKCIGCRKCEEICPTKAIKFKSFFKIDRSKCDLCGSCIENCFSGALKILGKFMSSEEVISEVIKDDVFYKKSGGGVTISGGEPLYQEEFLLDLLLNLKKYGINIAIETSGYGKWEVFSEALNYINYLLFDLKIFDNTKHLTLLGAGNELIKDNLLQASKRHIPIFIRIPIIPGYTSNTDNIIKIIDFVEDLDNIEAIHLLLYHRFGIPKYKLLDKEYKLHKAKPLSKHEFENILNIVKQITNKKIVIGG